MFSWPAVNSLVAYIPSLLEPRQAEALWTLSSSLKPGSVILEIGSYYGYSTCCLTYGATMSRSQVYAIDTFQGNPANTNVQDGASYYDDFVRNLSDRGLLPRVTILRGLSSDFYKSWDKPIDLLFVDGNHEYPYVKADLDAFFPHLAEGGILAMHDVWSWEGPTEVWNALQNRLVGIKFVGSLAIGQKVK